MKKKRTLIIAACIVIAFILITTAFVDIIRWTGSEVLFLYFFAALDLIGIALEIGIMALMFKYLIKDVSYITAAGMGITCSAIAILLGFIIFNPTILSTLYFMAETIPTEVAFLLLRLVEIGAQLIVLRVLFRFSFKQLILPLLMGSILVLAFTKLYTAFERIL